MSFGIVWKILGQAFRMHRQCNLYCGRITLVLASFEGKVVSDC
uniref:Uncharacterized protein n=1 Tax=Arundo donax TaxID=35708 RepID=A0A0A9E4R8_ARUDO